jgi:hypothetical protein
MDVNCRTYEGGLTICGPRRTVELVRKPLGVRWCFYCRKRVEFIYTLTGDAEPSYYEPNPSIECEPKGHWSGDLFPGWERTWE